MKILLLTCLFLSACSTAPVAKNEEANPAPTATAAMTATDLVNESTEALKKGDFARATKLDQQAFDLETKERTLPRNLWIEVVTTLGAGYALNGQVQRSHEILDYAIKQDQYPMFYYLEAVAYAQEQKEADAIDNLRLAYEFKANILHGEELPDPSKDNSFDKLRSSPTFEKALKEMTAGK
jgi:hypothetical protein